MGPSWPLLAALGPLLAALGLLLACSWAALGRSWLALGRSWSALCRSWPLFGRSWPLLGRSWAALGCSWAALGRSWAALGSLFGAQKRIKKGSKIDPLKKHQKNRSWVSFLAQSRPPRAPFSRTTRFSTCENRKVPRAARGNPRVKTLTFYKICTALGPERKNLYMPPF